MFDFCFDSLKIKFSGICIKNCINILLCVLTGVLKSLKQINKNVDLVQPKMRFLKQLFSRKIVMFL